jgi:hypothetical protein
METDLIYYSPVKKTRIRFLLPVVVNSLNANFAIIKSIVRDGDILGDDIPSALQKNTNTILENLQTCKNELAGCLTPAERQIAIDTLLSGVKILSDLLTFDTQLTIAERMQLNELITATSECLATL